MSVESTSSFVTGGGGGGGIFTVLKEPTIDTIPVASTF